MGANGRIHPVGTEESTAAQQTYARLKDLIVTLVLPPGSTIREAALQQQLGIGRTPLREALHRLALEGMLHIYPRRASVVASLGVPEVRQIFEARLALEPTAAMLAAERITAREAEVLLALGADLRERRDRADAAGFLDADQAFHRAIARLMQNALLAEYIDHVLTLNLWLWHMYFDACGVRGADLFAHDPIIEAITAGNARSAGTAMRDHIACSKEHLLVGLSYAVGPRPG